MSTARSEYDKWTSGSYAVSLGTVVLPDRQEEKKVVVAAAHNMVLLNEVPWNQTALSFRRIEAVIGSLG